jgi:hypothetical protein
VPNAFDTPITGLLLSHATDFNADLVGVGGAGHP